MKLKIIAALVGIVAALAPVHAEAQWLPSYWETRVQDDASWHHKMPGYEWAEAPESAFWSGGDAWQIMFTDPVIPTKTAFMDRVNGIEFGRELYGNVRSWTSMDPRYSYVHEAWPTLANMTLHLYCDVDPFCEGPSDYKLGAIVEELGLTETYAQYQGGHSAGGSWGVGQYGMNPDYVWTERYAGDMEILMDRWYTAVIAPMHYCDDESALAPLTPGGEPVTCKGFPYEGWIFAFAPGVPTSAIWTSFTSGAWSARHPWIGGQHTCVHDATTRCREPENWLMRSATHLSTAEDVTTDCVKYDNVSWAAHWLDLWQNFNTITTDAFDPASYWWYDKHSGAGADPFGPEQFDCVE